jgi:hypothetical protein
MSGILSPFFCKVLQLCSFIQDQLKLTERTEIALNYVKWTFFIQYSSFLLMLSL